MEEKRKNEFFNEYQRLNDEIDSMTKKKNKQSVKYDPNRKIFDGGKDPDPAAVLEKWRKEKELNEALENYRKPTQTLDFLKDKRERLKQEQERAKKKKENTLKKAVIGMLISAIITAGGATALAAASRGHDNAKVQKATQTLVDLGEDTLLEYGLGTEENGKFKIGNNTVEDYCVLDADTPMEVYIYKLAIDNHEEFDKFIQSVTYADGLYHYISYSQFLNINGYYAQETDEFGNPVNKVSNEVFTNMMQNTILTAYENQTLSNYEDEYYTSDLGSEPKTR